MWSLHDSPIFWWDASAVTPPALAISGFTSYTYLWFDSQPDGGGITPEESARIAKGDRRFMHQE